MWTPTYAGVTTEAIFISLGGPQAHVVLRRIRELQSPKPAGRLRLNNTIGRDAGHHYNSSFNFTGCQQ